MVVKEITKVNMWYPVVISGDARRRVDANVPLLSPTISLENCSFIWLDLIVCLTSNSGQVKRRRDNHWCNPETRLNFSSYTSIYCNNSIAWNETASLWKSLIMIELHNNNLCWEDFSFTLWTMTSNCESCCESLLWNSLPVIIWFIVLNHLQHWLGSTPVDLF